MNYQAAYDKLVCLIANKIPGFEIRFKNRHWHQYVLAFLLWPFNRRYLAHYTTTLYPRVYFPSQDWLESNYQGAFEVLAHEYVHLFDRKHEGAWSFNSAYLLPQLAGLGLLGLVGLIWNITFLACLVFAIPLAPWPSRGRTRIELRGYGMSVALDVWLGGGLTAERRLAILEQFVGWPYYRMSHDADEIEAALEYVETAAKNGVPAYMLGWLTEPLKDVYDLVQSCK